MTKNDIHMPNGLHMLSLRLGQNRMQSGEVYSSIGLITVV